MLVYPEKRSKQNDRLALFEQAKRSKYINFRF